jgi:hypothetical protein
MNQNLLDVLHMFCPRDFYRHESSLFHSLDFILLHLIVYMMSHHLKNKKKELISISPEIARIVVSVTTSDITIAREKRYLN